MAAILMLSTKQRFVNLDHVVTGYVTGREDDCQIILVMTSGPEVVVPQHYKTFAEAEKVLDQLATLAARQDPIPQSNFE